MLDLALPFPAILLHGTVGSVVPPTTRTLRATVAVRPQLVGAVSLTSEPAA